MLSGPWPGTTLSRRARRSETAQGYGRPRGADEGDRRRCQQGDRGAGEDPDEALRRLRTGERRLAPVLHPLRRVVRRSGRRAGARAAPAGRTDRAPAAPGLRAAAARNARGTPRAAPGAPAGPGRPAAVVALVAVAASSPSSSRSARSSASRSSARTQHGVRRRRRPSRRSGTRGSPTWSSSTRHERNLDYKHPVKVVVPVEGGVQEAGDDRRLEAHREGSPRPPDTRSRRCRAMGMVDGKVDLFAKLNQLSGERSWPSTTPRRRRSSIPGSRLDVEQRVTLAHELTHTLDDQHFDLTTVEKIGDKHDTDAVTALIEGDARWVREPVRRQALRRRSPRPTSDRSDGQVERGRLRGRAQDLRAPAAVALRLRRPVRRDPAQARAASRASTRRSGRRPIDAGAGDRSDHLPRERPARPISAPVLPTRCEEARRRQGVRGARCGTSSSRNASTRTSR